jgi:hypothetical protein
MTDRSSGPAEETSDEVTLRYEYDRSQRPSTAVVEGVAAATNCEPTALPPLQEFVDASALDALVASASGTDGDHVDVSFVYDGVEVRVTSVGTIEITPDADDE